LLPFSSTITDQPAPVSTSAAVAPAGPDPMITASQSRVESCTAADFFVGVAARLTVTGELVTDGTLGALTSANIVDWNLTIDSAFGPETLLGDSGGSNSLLVAFGDSLTATPDGLFFDFSGLGLLWVTNGGLPHAGSYWCLDNGTGICSVFSGESVGSKSAIEGFRGWAGVEQIATLKSTDVPDVPEPASLLLLAVGTAGVLRRRRRFLLD